MENRDKYLYDLDKEIKKLTDLDRSLAKMTCLMTPQKIEIHFFENKNSQIIENPSEAYWCDDMFKYVKDGEEHWFNAKIIKELIITHRKKESEH